MLTGRKVVANHGSMFMQRQQFIAAKVTSKLFPVLVKKQGVHIIPLAILTHK